MPAKPNHPEQKKSFKGYLLEYTKHEINELISRGAIPLDPGMMDRLGFLEREQLGYHLTNDRYIEEMVKNQNKKKQISCFTKGGPELARLPSEPNILLILEGTTVIKGKTDIWTLVSTRDRRWLDIGSRNPKLRFLVQGVLQSVANKVNIDIDMYKIKQIDLNQLILNLDKKQKIDFYRLYVREMESMINRSYKVLIDYLQTAADMDYNEVILTKWEILDVWCLEHEQPALIEKLSRLGISYAGVMARRDLSSLSI